MTQRPVEIRLTTIPGTSFVALTDDKNLTPKAIEAKDIRLENSINELPEIQALRVGDVAVDIGAFIGETALVMAQNGATVLAFEPQTDAYLAAVINCRSNTNIHLFNAPLGDGDTVGISGETMHGKGNLGTRRIDAGGSDLVAYKLDSFFASRHCTLIKIDVEGYELPVLLGAKETIKKHRPILIIEIYPEMMALHGFNKEQVFDLLRKWGYEWREAVGNSTEPRWDIVAKPILF